MKKKILIVEDLFIEANDLEIMLTKAGYIVTGSANSVKGALESVEKETPDLVLVDIFLKGDRTGIDLAHILNEKDIPFIFVSANSNHDVLLAAKVAQPYGFIVKPFREHDLLVNLEIAWYRYENGVEARMRKVVELQDKLINIVAEKEGREQKMLKAIKVLQTGIPFDYIVAGFKTQSSKPYNAISFLRVGFSEYQTIGIPELQVITHKTVSDIVKLQATTPIDYDAKIIKGDDFVKTTIMPSMRKLIADTFHLNSMIVFPIPLEHKETFHLFLYSKQSDVYMREHLELLKRLKTLLAKVVEEMLITEKKPVAERPMARISKVSSYRSSDEFEGIIGKSHLLLNVFDHVSQVAAVNTSVLILGESGTGKERIAKSIHNLSDRNKYPLIKINCAALPANLIESELFGHEKGAFTGAIDKRIGKFEMADKGTLFLDEIGEMPLELQVKLLRVLQEKEIERVGGVTPIKLDVRIIAATNRDLEKEVAAGRFRLDLYYRLNIFPIKLPPLRNRKEDISLLISYFLEYFSRKLGKTVIAVAPEALKEAVAYPWPGNIRELQNLIERGVLLAKGSVITDLQLPLPKPERTTDDAVPLDGRFKSIADNEREHIIRALKQCKGKVWGEGGAAELLNLPPSTLNSKMKKLGIRKNFL